MRSDLMGIFTAAHALSHALICILPPACMHTNQILFNLNICVQHKPINFHAISIPVFQTLVSTKFLCFSILCFTPLFLSHSCVFSRSCVLHPSVPNRQPQENFYTIPMLHSYSSKTAAKGKLSTLFLCSISMNQRHETVQFLQNSQSCPINQRSPQCQVRGQLVNFPVVKNVTQRPDTTVAGG